MAKKQKVSVVGSLVTVEYPTIRKSVSCDVSKFGKELFLAAALHGVKQRLGDAESGGTPAEKFAMASRIVEEAFGNDSWDLTSRETDNGIVVEAVARIKDIDESDVRAALEKLDEDDQSAKVKEWKSNAKVKAMIATIRAERANEAAEESNEEIEI